MASIRAHKWLRKPTVSSPTIFSLAACIGSVLALLVLCACDGGLKKRPYGYIRIGKAAELLNEETELSKYGLLLRRDAVGWSVMSTFCTFDLSHLKRKEVAGKLVYASDYSESTYDLYGKVISGPAKADLPYYNLVLGTGDYDGGSVMLFVEVGEEKPAEWRLEVPLLLIPR